MYLLSILCLTRPFVTWMCETFAVIHFHVIFSGTTTYIIVDQWVATTQLVMLYDVA